MRATRDQVERWKRAGLVRVERALGQSWVTPTRRGLDRVGLDLPQWAVPVTRVRHCHAVNVVRLHWEADPRSKQAPWVCERLTYRERGEARWHVPDGVLRDVRAPLDGPTKHIAVEIELTHKTRKVLAQEVFLNLRAGVETVAYYVADEAFAERLRSDIRAMQVETRTSKAWSVALLPEVPGVPYMAGGR